MRSDGVPRCFGHYWPDDRTCGTCFVQAHCKGQTPAGAGPPVIEEKPEDPEGLERLLRGK